MLEDYIDVSLRYFDNGDDKILVTGQIEGQQS
jgi:hypothetical protein